jgi:hypothetical protein
MLIAVGCFAMVGEDAYTSYINRYAELAVEQQQRYSIPASITLAQGLLESSAGRSRLASEGHNHFGIKCGINWEGDYMLRSDDAPDECFRNYNTDEESYDDHSQFLRKKRYSSLFELEPTDYAGWAQGLSRCGYATDPNYADRLITIIERYALYCYDGAAIADAEETASFIISNLQSTHPVRRNALGLHYVIAAPGDSYESIAREFGIKERKLASLNDADTKTNIPDWQEVFLEEKSLTPPDGINSATIGEGETMHSVSQRFGMKLSKVMALNPKAKDCPGTVLRLK